MRPRPEPKEPDPLRPLLENWQPPIQCRPDLADRVLAEGRRRAVLERARPGFGRSLQMAAAIILLFLGGAVGMWHADNQAERHVEERTAWLLGINPVVRAASSQSLDGDVLQPLDRLDWMRREFDLAPDQFRRLGRLQSRFAPEFQQLYLDLTQLEADYRTFEMRRREGEMVDFIALYELLQERDAIRSAAQATSSDFLGEFFAILQPSQQSAFHQLLARSAPELAIALPAPRDA